MLHVLKDHLQAVATSPTPHMDLCVIALREIGVRNRKDVSEHSLAFQDSKVLY